MIALQLVAGAGAARADEIFSEREAKKAAQMAAARAKAAAAAAAQAPIVAPDAPLESRFITNTELAEKDVRMNKSENGDSYVAAIPGEETSAAPAPEPAAPAPEVPEVYVPTYKIDLPPPGAEPEKKATKKFGFF